MREKIPAFNFIRAICAIGIIWFHFGTGSNSTVIHSILVSYANETRLGYIVVTVFFIISGSLLYYNHPRVKEVWKFFKKRWLTIFPAFYIAYAGLFLLKTVANRGIDDKPLPLFILTVLGMDGYTSAATNFENWYLIGEWFLGIIIILYLLYPVLTILMERNTVGLYFGVALLYFISLNIKMLNMDPFRNPFACLFSFVVGMAIARHQLYRSKALSAISIFGLLALCIIPVGLDINLGNHLAGICAFFLLFYIGDNVMKQKTVSRLFNWIGTISYDIFLLQHIILGGVQKVYNPEEAGVAILELLLTTVLIMVLALVLHMISKWVVNFCVTVQNR